MEDSTRYKVRSFLVYLNLSFLLQALKLDGDIIQVGEGVQSEEIVFKWVNQRKAMISYGLFLQGWQPLLWELEPRLRIGRGKRAGRFYEDILCISNILTVVLENGKALEGTWKEGKLEGHVRQV